MESFIKRRVYEIMSEDMFFDFNKNHKDFDTDLEAVQEGVVECVIDNFNNSEPADLNVIIADITDGNYSDTLAHSDDISNWYYNPQIELNFTLYSNHIGNEKRKLCDFFISKTNYDCYSIIMKYADKIINKEVENEEYGDWSEYHDLQMDQLVQQREDESVFDWTKVKFDSNALMPDKYRINDY